MISFANRFHGHGSLRYVYNHGQTVRGPLCALRYGRNERRSQYRLAVVVGKKVHKSAVVRNRVRRRLYEAFRRQAPNFNDVYDMVVTVFSDVIATMPADEVERLVAAQLRQAGVISKSNPATKE